MLTYLSKTEMKNIFLLAIISFFVCGEICSATATEVSENDIQMFIMKNKKESEKYKNEKSVIENNKMHNRLFQKTWEEIKEYETTEVEGVYRLGQLVTCRNELDLSFFYGEPKEMDRLIAIYFLLTKEPFTPENFEPSSQIYIKAKGKVKTNISRSGDLEGVFFLTKLLEYSSDKDLINKCRRSESGK